jgi:hypothetical protein
MNEATRNEQRPAEANVKSKGASDDPRHAPESGGPGETGRLHGRDLGQGEAKQSHRAGDDEPMPGRSEDKGNEGRIGDDMESGRQDAT